MQFKVKKHLKHLNSILFSNYSKLQQPNQSFRHTQWPLYNNRHPEWTTDSDEAVWFYPTKPATKSNNGHVTVGHSRSHTRSVCNTTQCNRVGARRNVHHKDQLSVYVGWKAGVGVLTLIINQFQHPEREPIHSC